VMMGKRATVLGVCAPGCVEAQPDKPSVYEIDTSNHFYTDMATTDRNQLIEWARAIALKLKFAIVIGKPDNDNDINSQSIQTYNL
ncbi:hypothetical protein L195_g006105, partial [Trifolium pratense]